MFLLTLQVDFVFFCFFTAFFGFLGFFLVRPPAYKQQVYVFGQDDEPLPMKRCGDLVPFSSLF